MEKLTCKFCGGDLVEINGIFYCWSCDAKYALINGEPRLLKCKICGGDVVDCGDHYECELCGKRYEKPVPKPEPVVSAPAQKEEKPVPKKEERKEEDFSDWEKVFYKGYNSAFAARTPEEAEKAIAVLEECHPKAVELIQKIEDDTEYTEACSEICVKFFGAVKFLCDHSFMEDKSLEALKMTIAAKEEQDSLKAEKLHTKALKLLNESIDNDMAFHEIRQKLSKLSSDFLFEILNISRDYVFTKMVAERAVEIFTGSDEKDVKLYYCPHIMAIIYGCDENMEISQEKLTAAYWKNHPGKNKKLSAEKAELEKERDEIEAEEEKCLDEEERKTEAIRKEIEEAEKKSNEAWNRSRRLNFFQKKEKKRLEAEMQEAFILKHNLEEKLKLREKEEEKNRDKIINEWAKKDTELDDRIDDIERELERNHYPFEDDFVEMFNTEMKKAEKNQ